MIRQIPASIEPKQRNYLRDTNNAALPDVHAREKIPVETEGDRA